jgi:cellulose synthase/poly-beta-1,6-N-acetylglucosamine synthase-like glycosyltransferase
MEGLLTFNFVFTILFTICYSYQVVYVIVSLFSKKSVFPKPLRYHKYAIVVPARNEEVVLPQLIDSIHHQNYPPELIDIFVVADSCTDNTASLARSKGAIVYERSFDAKRVGKGFALEYVLKQILRNHADEKYDAYIVLDADNLLDPNYVAEMNRSFSQGERVLTSYRNSKNYGSNWISAGYSLWFLREARYLNHPRHQIGTSCAISGTGFLIHHEIVERMEGWDYFLLTEDIEFTIANVIEGERIGYCDGAILYDEQPVSFMQSWRQRLRWAKGYLQVFQKYGARLFKRLFSTGNFACADMIMSTAPTVLFLMMCTIVNLIACGIGVLLEYRYVAMLFQSVWGLLLNMYLSLFIIGVITTITEWNMIHTTAMKKILYTFSFPIFILTYLPISLAAVFMKVEWKPIQHSLAHTIDDVTK